MTEFAIVAAALIVLVLGWTLFGNRPKPPNSPPNSPHFDTGYVVVWRIGDAQHHLILTYRCWDGVDDDAKIRSNALVFERIEDAIEEANACKMRDVAVERATDAVARIRAARAAYEQYLIESKKYDVAYEEYRRKWDIWIEDPNTFKLAIPKPVAPVRPERPA